MPAPLEAFLAANPPLFEGNAVWGGGTVPLSVQAGSSGRPPPLELTTSVRAVVLRDNQVVVIRDRTGHSLLPGGRREEGESLEDTVRREVLEETGWTIRPLRCIGYLRFHHLGPRQDGYAYPYPDFLQAVYAAVAVHHRGDDVISDEWVLSSRLVPVSEIDEFDLWPPDRIFLESALSAAAPEGR